MRGWVYVISNKAMEGIVKVGHSTKDPELRAQELNHTGSPHPYVVEYEMLIEEPYMVEQTVHKILSQFHEGKEWFRCPSEQAVAAIKQAAGDKQILENFRRTDREKAEELQQKDAGETQETREAHIRETSQQIINKHYKTIKDASFYKHKEALAYTYQNRGEDFAKNCLFNRAIEDFNKRIQLDPNHSDAYISRGRAYERLGDKRKAISNYKKACDLGNENGCKALQMVLEKR